MEFKNLHQNSRNLPPSIDYRPIYEVADSTEGTRRHAHSINTPARETSYQVYFQIFYIWDILALKLRLTYKIPTLLMITECDDI